MGQCLAGTRPQMWPPGEREREKGTLEKGKEEKLMKNGRLTERRETYGGNEQTTIWDYSTPSLKRRINVDLRSSQSLMPLPQSQVTHSSSTPSLDCTPTNGTQESFFDLVNRLQTYRLDDQRCTMPKPDKSPWTPSRQKMEDILRSSPPYAQIIFPSGGGFWIDSADQDLDDFDTEGNPLLHTASTPTELDESPCRTYRAHFLQSEHFNFCG